MTKFRRPRKIYRYHFIWRGKVVHRGQTEDLAERGRQHQKHWRGGWIKKIGPAVTLESALRWEQEGGKRI